jgi:hypothetical protein
MTVLGLLPEGFILYIVCKSCIYCIIRGEFVIGAYAPDFDRLVSAEMQICFTCIKANYEIYREYLLRGEETRYNR